MATTMDAGKRWVPDREGRFEDVIEAIRMVDARATYRDVQEELGIAPSTMSGVMNRRDRYLQEAEPTCSVERARRRLSGE